MSKYSLFIPLLCFGLIGALPATLKELKAQFKESVREECPKALFHPEFKEASLKRISLQESENSLRRGKVIRYSFRTDGSRCYQAGNRKKKVWSRLAAFLPPRDLSHQNLLESRVSLLPALIDSTAGEVFLDQQLLWARKGISMMILQSGSRQDTLHALDDKPGILKAELLPGDASFVLNETGSSTPAELGLAVAGWGSLLQSEREGYATWEDFRLIPPAKITAFKVELEALPRSYEEVEKSPLHFGSKNTASFEELGVIQKTLWEKALDKRKELENESREFQEKLDFKKEGLINYASVKKQLLNAYGERGNRKIQPFQTALENLQNYRKSLTKRIFDLYIPASDLIFTADTATEHGYRVQVRYAEGDIDFVFDGTLNLSENEFLEIRDRRSRSRSEDELKYSKRNQKTSYPKAPEINRDLFLLKLSFANRKISVRYNGRKVKRYFRFHSLKLLSPRRSWELRGTVLPALYVRKSMNYKKASSKKTADLLAELPNIDSLQNILSSWQTLDGSPAKKHCKLCWTLLGAGVAFGAYAIFEQSEVSRLSTNYNPVSLEQAHEQSVVIRRREDRRNWAGVLSLAGFSASWISWSF